MHTIFNDCSCVPMCKQLFILVEISIVTNRRNLFVGFNGRVDIVQRGYFYFKEEPKLNDHTFKVLEFGLIKETIASFALTTTGKENVLALEPSTNIKQIEAWLDELSEAVEIMNKSTSVPVHGLEGMDLLLRSLNKGVPLRPDQLSNLGGFLDNCGKMRRFMKDKEWIAPRVSSYIFSIEELPALEEEIIRCIRNGGVDDYASKELLKVRKQISIQEDRLKEKVFQMVRSSKLTSFLQENVVSQRDGRYVIPVKKEYRNKIKGAVLDTSASGATLFIEPEEIALHQEQLTYVKAEEEAEVQKILLYLTGLVEQNEQQIRLAVETMVHYDVLFAKAKYSRTINGKKPKVNQSHYIQLVDARHPLLGSQAVPLTFELGKPENALVITGPNTGGKTVTIKTVGLLTLMAQTGLHLPVAEGSSISVFQNILVDIGDGQSIMENLSTFSSRIVNIIEILKETNDRSLVLLDELGSGTDPGEGMGLATAILEQLYAKGATLLATTHYSEIKEFADQHEGFINGSMEFDLESLTPTYRLNIGKGGESQAFAIALKLGIHPKIIERAHEITYKEGKSYSEDEGDSAVIRERKKQIIVNRHQQRARKTIGVKSKVPTFKQGDNVAISPANVFGIVYKGPDEQGNYIVQVKGEKATYNHKRLKLHIAANELYPDDYDFDIIFESAENRKNKNILSRKHVDGLSILHEE
ncbi:MutS2 family protein [Mesobacillus persicus]|uniref:MutS2 family protein n=1 Tax=Mesobacillus persicus TaxID=930146 RepID=A0A1H7VUR1_9BACI|nr:MutS2 family protein [Mesobacillus persicus]